MNDPKHPPGPPMTLSNMRGPDRLLPQRRLSASGADRCVGVELPGRKQGAVGQKPGEMRQVRRPG